VVLAARIVVAEGLHLVDGVGEVVVAAGREDHVLHVQVASGIGDPAYVALTADLCGTIDEHLRDLSRPTFDQWLDLIEAVGLIGGDHIYGLHPVAADPVIDTSDPGGGARAQLAQGRRVQNVDPIGRRVRTVGTEWVVPLGLDGEHPLAERADLARLQAVEDEALAVVVGRDTTLEIACEKRPRTSCQ
jgi:hypothetical protein